MKSNAMGELQEFDAQLALSPVKGNPFEAENFYPADGFFSEATGCGRGYSMSRFGACMKNKRSGPRNFDGENMSEAGGFLGKLREGSKKRQAARQERRKTRSESRAEARKLRSQARLEQAQGQRVAAESLGKDSQSDIELAKALQTKNDSKGLSMGAKIGIGVGVVAVLGLITFLAVRRRS